MQATNEVRVRFHQLLEAHLNTVIKRFENELLTPTTMRNIRETIRSRITTVFMKSSHNLFPNALTWLTDQYFKSITLGPGQLMSDQVVINEYPLSELEFTDVQLLRNLFLETRLGPELDAELTRRSVS